MRVPRWLLWLLLPCLLAALAVGYAYHAKRSYKARVAARLQALSIPSAPLPGAAEENAAPAYAPLMKGGFLDAEERQGLDAALASPQPPEERWQALVDSHRGKLQALAVASRLPYWDLMSGVGELKLGTPMPVLAGVVDAVRLMLVEGRLMAARGRVPEAASNAAVALAVARQLGEQPNASLIGLLVAKLILDRAAPLLSAVLERRLGGRAEWESLAQTLRALEEGRIDLAQALRRDTEITEKAELLVIETGLDSLPLLPSKVRGEFLAESRSRLTQIGEAMAQASRSNDPGLLRRHLEELRAYALANGATGKPPNPWGSCPFKPPRISAACLAAFPFVDRPDYAKLIVPYHLSRARLSLLRAGAGLRLFEADQGRPPASLSELVPAYLARLPQDPFDGFQPLRYRMEGALWTLHSIGPDRQDQGGTVPYAGDDSPGEPYAAGDLVLRSAAAPPKAPARRPAPAKRRGKRRRP